MRKKILLCLLFALCCGAAQADEGMWLPSLIKSRIKDMRSKGFRLTAEDIYSVNKASMKDAVVLFGGGCTGEFVSAEGLLLTNHHCGYGSIQSLSSIEHDYLTNGFWAMSRREELPVAGLSVKILVRMEDVTARVAAGEKPADIVKQASTDAYSANIQQMYYGNQQFLFVYEVFNDVRLVGAPPSSIGKFGGDTDNWIWPRHTGDFSVFRVYADKDNRPAKYSAENVPYTPKRHFPVSTKGVAEGDFTMIYGFPGNTQEYVTSDAVEYVTEVSNPMKIALRTIRLDIISAAQAADEHVRIQYASKHASIANSWKKWQGEALGLRRTGAVERKRTEERAFASWAADIPEYAHLLDSIHAAYNAVKDDYFEYELYSESINAIEIVRFARSAATAARAAAKADDATKKAELTARIADMRSSFTKDYSEDIDRATAKRMLEEYIKRMPQERKPQQLAQAVADHGGIEAYIDYLFDNTRLLKAELADPAVIEGDVMTAFADMFTTTVNRIRSATYRNLSNIPSVERWYRPYMKALMKWNSKQAFYPDANLTLRVAYGSVAGYQYADAEYHRPVTTIDGIIEKDNPQIYDYDIPQSLRDIYSAKDYGRWGSTVDGRRSVAVCFLATNHTSGGNSGSPIINGRGELVGINFDRTWLATMSDMEFDPSVCRNISVDIRYVLFTIDRIGGAGYLLQEMDMR